MKSLKEPRCSILATSTPASLQLSLRPAGNQTRATPGCSSPTSPRTHAVRPNTSVNSTRFPFPNRRFAIPYSESTPRFLHFFIGPVSRHNHQLETKYISFNNPSDFSAARQDWPVPCIYSHSYPRNLLKIHFAITRLQTRISTYLMSVHSCVTCSLAITGKSA